MKLLLLIDYAPTNLSRFKESLDAALTSAAFGLQVSLLFTGEAVRHLDPQLPQQQKSKHPSESLQELAVYDIEEVYVQEKGLARHKLDKGALTIAAKSLSEQEIGILLSEQSTVLHF